MKKKYFLPSQDALRLLWLNNFDGKLIAHAAALGITAPQLLIVLNDTNAFAYCMLLKASVKTYGFTVTNYLKNLGRGPIGTVAAAFPLFTPPPSSPTAVPYGVFPRTLILIRQIKTNTSCTDAIALDLGIVGSDVDPALDTKQPVLTLTVSGGRNNIKYVRGGLGGIQLESRRGSETDFSFLATVTTTNYIDSRANLIASSSEVREYRAWFFVKDEIIGIVSAVVSNGALA